LPLSPFIGPDGYGYKTEQRPRAPRAPSPPVDQSRAHQVRLELTLKRAYPITRPPEGGLPFRGQPADQQQPPAPKRAIPRQPADEDEAKRRAAAKAAGATSLLPQSRVTLFIGRNAVAGANAFGGSLPVPFQGDIVELILTAAAEVAFGAGSFTQEVFLGFTPTQVTTSAAILAGTPLFPLTASATAINLNSVELANSSPLRIVSRIPVPLYPSYLGAVFSFAGAGFATFSVAATFESTPGEVVRTSGAIMPTLTAAITRTSTMPRPPATEYIQPTPTTPALPSTLYARLEALAIELAKTPGGTFYEDALWRARRLGFTDTKAAVEAAIQLAADRPDLAAIARTLV